MTKKTIILSAAMTILISIVFLSSVAKASLSNEQTIMIKNNCLSAKSSLRQLHASDALARVNSGQIYESLGTKLMEKLNIRLTNNGISNETMNSLTANYKNLLDVFRQDYMLYENQIVRALGVDCTSQPVAFYNAISEAKIMRSKVYVDVQGLNKFIRDYEASLLKFQETYQSTGGGN